MEHSSMDDQRLAEAVARGVNRARRTKTARKVALLAAAALVLSVGAVVATVRHGAVDWRGNRIPELDYVGEPMTEPVATLTPKEQTLYDMQREVDDWRQALDAAQPETEFWLTKDDVGDMGAMLYSPAQGRSVKDLDALRDGIAGSGLLTPVSVPEGYALTESRLTYYLTDVDLAGMEMIEEADGPHGAKLRKYRPGTDVTKQVDGYHLTYESADGARLYYSGTLVDDREEMSFGVSEHVAITAEQVPGMDEALMRQDDDGTCSLHALRRGLPERDVVKSFDFDGEAGLRFRYNAAQYDVSSTSLGREAVLEMMAALG